MNAQYLQLLTKSCFVALAGLFFSTSIYAQQNTPPSKVYRWEDSGLTTYQDRAPSSQQDNGHAILSKQGVVVKEVLSRDLTRTRDDRIGMIDGLISRLDDRIRILSERLSVVDKRILQQEKSRGEENAQESLYAEQHSIQRNIENAWSLIDSKAAERSVVAVKFEDDLIRYRELKTEMGRN